MKYPYKKLVVPAKLLENGVLNGKLPAALLSPLLCGGKMYRPVAKKFNEMYEAALVDGVELRNIGDYRSFEQQLALFKQRYSLVDEGRKPQITRTYKGETWYLKKKMSPSATPDPTGKNGSNHGWGLAIDLDVTKVKTARWLMKNAPTYGFYLQGDNPESREFELWHWQFCG